MQKELFNKIVQEVTQSAIKTFLKNMIEEDVDGFNTDDIRKILSSLSASITINIINLHIKEIDDSLDYLVITTAHEYSILLYERYLAKDFREKISNDLIKTEIAGIAKKNNKR